MSDTSLVVSGRYQLEERIAVGGVAEVWRGTDKVLGRPVAVKLLQAGHARDPGSLALFQSEARHAASLSHPNIAQVYDYGQAEPPYLVMELVEGPSLAQVLRGGPLDAGRAMDVVAQAAQGLAAAHRAGMVHGDIKPGNLLVSSGGQVKVADFGISCAAGSAPVTGRGTLLGTPAYLAPERVAGQPPTPPSDLYSLGVVGWECLTGAPPFSGPPVEVALAHRDRPLPPLPSAVPADVAALIAELTAGDPVARPPDAGEVARRAGMLRDIANSRATLMLEIDPDLLTAQAPDGPAGFPSRPRGWTLPAKAALGAGALLAVVAIAVLLANTLSRSGFQAGIARSPAAPSATTAAATVEVSPGALKGQPVDEVRSELQQLGLTVRVERRPSGQDPGTVLSVHPSGSVPAGSTITLTVAAPHHGHGNGQGNGD
jgi:eukaryotic-like serine/threonine-protein kinase